MEVSFIDALKANLEHAAPMTPGTRKSWCDHFNLDFSQNSCAIEGNSLTLHECKVILEDGIAIGGKSIREHLEVINHWTAIQYIGENIERPLSTRTITHIHFWALNHEKENAGIFRKIPVMIAGADVQPPLPFLVKQLMDDLLEKYHTEWQNEHILKRIALFHLNFEHIHPFVDGNGRTGRLIINLELVKNGYPPIIIPSKKRREYYQAFADYHRTKTENTLLQLMLEGLEKQYNLWFNLLGQ